MKSAKWAGVVAFATLVLGGCNDHPTGLTTVPANSANNEPTGTGAATLSWQAPTTTTDGAALTDLAGYRIYYGTDSGDLTASVQINSVGLQTYMIDNLGGGTWYFAIKAVTSTGVESALSEIVSKTIG